MKIAYDAATDSMYIHIREGVSVESEEVADGFVLDFDADGNVVGIDIEDASKKADTGQQELVLHMISSFGLTSKAA